MSREHPMQVSPAGKPHVKTLLTPTSHGKLSIHTGHGTEIGPTQAERSFTGGKPGGKKLVDIHTGHGTEYCSETSRG